MKSKFAAYKKAEDKLPDTHYRWPLYGQGIESLGVNGCPVEERMPEINADQLLVRVDAAGLCFSDIKVLNQGNRHPRIFGRDMIKHPVILGHEASLTIVKVGDRRKGQFEPGQRYLIQADIFHKGVSKAFGYALEGALQQYCIIGEEALEGDEGVYLIPVNEDDGYAEVALSEPWACVEAAYRIEHRRTYRNGGLTWFIGCEDGKFDDYYFSKGFSHDNHPSKVFASHISGGFKSLLEEYAGKYKFDIIWKEAGKVFEDAGELAKGNGGFDDIIVLGTPEPEIVEETSKLLAYNGVYAIISDKPVERKTELDAGRIHYDNLSFVGTTSCDISDAYMEKRSSDLMEDGRALLIGAGGPMGQMHIQRAVGMENGCSTIVASDIDSERLKELQNRFSQIAVNRGASLYTINPAELKEKDYYNQLMKLSDNGRYTDVVALVPVPVLIEQAADWLGQDGILNIFAGVGRGTMAKLDISGIYLKGQRWIGSSGSSISDLKYTLKKTQEGLLSPNQSIAAIGGLNAAADGLAAVKEGRFPGKIVIWPQILDLPLIPLKELYKELPQVAAKFTEEGFWTKEAEEELLKCKVFNEGD